MKKTLSLIFVIHLFLLCGLDAQNLVTEAETRSAAVHYAQSFLQYKNISPSNIVTIDSYEENSITLMREVVFDNGLSVLLSAYRPCLPVLLYSTSNTPILPNIEIIPDGLRDFILNYAGAIAYASDESRNLNEHSGWALLLSKNLSDTITRSGHVYGPLLTTRWGQSFPNHGSVCNAYNYYVTKTDEDCSCDTCPTGCVATAMAQIMKYWNYPVCTVDSIVEGSHNWNHLERAVFNIHPSTTQDYCVFELPLWTHYHLYYDIYNNSTPDPYANVPKTFTRLISVPNAYQSSWRTIPTGAISEYVAHEEVILLDGFLAETGSDFYAHIAPCESCDDRMVTGETSDVAGGGNDNPTDTLPAPKSLQTEATQSGDAALTVYPNPTDELLYIELSGAGIATVALYDLQGRVVMGTHTGAPQQGGTATMSMRNVPAGVYVLRVTDADGKEYRQKVVRR